MLSEEFIKSEKENLTDLGNMLHKEVVFSKSFLDKSNNHKNEKGWFKLVNSTCNYETFIIQNLVTTLDNYKKFSEEQIGLYIGKIAIQSFLEIINAYELSTNNLVESNEKLQEMLKSRISKKIEIIENSWKTEVNSKSRDFKKDLITNQRRKNREMNFIRDTLKKNKIIDDLDYKILKFAWDIRNSMHNNFLAISDIKFSAPQTSLNYSFDFKKGEELYHPTDLKSFYSITEQIIYIQFKILQYFNGVEGVKKQKLTLAHK